MQHLIVPLNSLGAWNLCLWNPIHPSKRIPRNFVEPLWTNLVYQPFQYDKDVDLRMQGQLLGVNLSLWSLTLVRSKQLG